MNVEASNACLERLYVRNSSCICPVPAGIPADLNNTLGVLCKNANDLNVVKEEIKNW